MQHCQVSARGQCCSRCSGLQRARLSSCALPQSVLTPFATPSLPLHLTPSFQLNHSQLLFTSYTQKALRTHQEHFSIAQHEQARSLLSPQSACPSCSNTGFVSSLLFQEAFSSLLKTSFNPSAVLLILCAPCMLPRRLMQRARKPRSPAVPTATVRRGSISTTFHYRSTLRSSSQEATRPRRRSTPPSVAGQPRLPHSQSTQPSFTLFTRGRLHRTA